MQTPVAQFEDISKKFRTFWRPARTVQALCGVSFEIAAGEAFGLLGPNRAGKTTLIKILLGLSHPSAGRVTRLGRPLADRSTLARVGYMHENQAFPRYLSAHALLHYYGELSWIPPAVLKSRVPALLDRVGLTDRAREPIARFSKGMVQRLALAQALLNEPDLLVLDEPMEGLDLNGRHVLREVISQQRKAGKSVLLVSHALGEIGPICDRLAVLVDGRLAFFGSLESALRDPDTGSASTLEVALRRICRSSRN